jgi:hypothetical protein
MPSKADFQTLIDWCSQPHPNQYIRPVASALVVRSSADAPLGGSFRGDLFYIPPRASRWFPEHFSGQLLSPQFQGGVTASVAIGDDYAGVGFQWMRPSGAGAGYEEWDVYQVQVSGTFLSVVFDTSSSQAGYELNMYVWGGFAV